MKNLTLSYLKKSAVLFILLFALAFLFMPSGVASAESATIQCILATPSNLTSNSVAGVSTIPIRTSSGNILFNIPESFYAKVVAHNKDLKFYTVEYADMAGTYSIYESDIGGAVAKDVVFESGVSLYPNVLLQLNDGQTITIDGHDITKADNFTIKYLGSKDTDIYVSCKTGDVQYFGLAPKASFQPILVPYHPITEAKRNAALNPTPTPGQEKGDTTKATSTTLRILLIVGIAVPAVIIVLLLFRPSKNDSNYDKRSVQKHKKKKNDYDYDRNRSYGREDDDRYRTSQNDRPKYRQMDRDRTSQNDRQRDYDSQSYSERDRRDSQDRYTNERDFEDRDRRDIDSNDSRDFDNRDRR